MRILITGCLGQLGCELVRQANDLDFEVFGLDVPEIDITDLKRTEKMVSEIQPNLLINAAAYTAVDKAESEADLALSVNKEGPANLAESCRKKGIPLIHISTDFVFDGKKDSPYVETDPISPLGVYGETKAEGEKAVRAAIEKHVIIRTAWLYGSEGYNFVKTMLKLGRKNEEIRVVSDQHGSPTSAKDLAEAVLDISQRIRHGEDVSWGTYHYCGRGITSWHGFAVKIFELASMYDKKRMTPTVHPIPTAEYPTPARRPAFSALNCDLIREKFGIHTKPWEESLEVVIEQLVKQGKNFR